jgi:hypothetical protein
MAGVVGDADAFAMSGCGVQNGWFRNGRFGLDFLLLQSMKMMAARLRPIELLRVHQDSMGIDFRKNNFAV